MLSYAQVLRKAPEATNRAAGEGTARGGGEGKRRLRSTSSSDEGDSSEVLSRNKKPRMNTRDTFAVPRVPKGRPEVSKGGSNLVGNCNALQSIVSPFCQGSFEIQAPNRRHDVTNSCPR